MSMRWLLISNSIWNSVVPGKFFPGNSHNFGNFFPGGEGMSKYFSVLKTYPFKIKYPKPQSLKFYKSLSLTRENPLVFIQVTWITRNWNLSKWRGAEILKLKQVKRGWNIETQASEEGLQYWNLSNKWRGAEISAKKTITVFNRLGSRSVHSSSTRT